MNTTFLKPCARAVAVAGTLLAQLLHGRAAQAADAPREDTVEEVVVTGTLIRQAAPVGSSLIGVSQDELQQSGANTVSDMLRTLPQVTNTGVTESSRSGTGGAGNIVYGNSISLRGLSPYATLTLVNGHRVPPAGTLGASVDPDAFPSLMLQRVDVVPDGASATYGSDAVAGVVNLVLRRDVRGAEARVRYGVADNYEENQQGLVFGTGWGSGQVSIGLEQVYHSNLSGSNRSFFASDQRARGGSNYSSIQCNPGTITVNGVNYAIPAGGVTPATAGSLVAGTANLCDPLKSEDLLPAVRHQTAAITFDQKFGERVSLYGDATYASRNYLFRGGATTLTADVPSTNAFFVAPPGTTPASETVNYSFGNDPRTALYNSGKDINSQLTLGLRVKLWGDWQYQVGTTLGRDRTFALNPPAHNPDRGALGAALSSADPATALNLFGGPNADSVLAGIYNSRFYAPGDGAEQVIDTQVDGSLFHLAGGNVRAAVGGQWRHDEFAYGFKSGVAGAPFPQDFGLDVNVYRHSESAFAEVVVPFFGHDNAIPGIRSLDLDIAGRYEHYSDFGATSHPKFGLNWSPAEGWLVHASYGTSFRAPLLSELVGPIRGVFVQTYSDPLAAGGTSIGYTLGGGNTKLKPESATTYSAGIDFTPSDGTRISLTYYDIEYRNQVTAYLSDLNILRKPDQLGSLVTRCPSAACTALLDQYTNPASPDFLPLLGPPIPPAVFVNGLPLNLGTTQTSGFDLQASHVLKAASGDWTFGLSGNLVTRYDVQYTPGSQSFDVLNTIGNPMRLRLRGTLGWAAGAWRTLLFANYANSYDNNETSPVQSVSAYTTLDLDVSYDLGKALGSHWANGLAATLHVMNLANSDPPYVNIAISPNGGGGFDPAGANPIGRLVSLAVGKKF